MIDIKLEQLRIFCWNFLFHVPLFSFFFLVFVFANMGLPGTSGFIGEFLIFNNLSFSSLITVIFLFFAFFLTGCYTVWHMVRLLYTPFASVTLFSYCDLTFKEFVVFFFFLLFILIFGLYSSLFFDFLY
jgi:NADH-quinone oxidoreductase subunit M